MGRSCLKIGPPTRIRTDSGTWRVTAIIDKQEVYFESAAPLAMAAEAFLGAFLFPAMSRGMNLRIAAPVCPDWLRNIETARSIAQQWWEYSGGEIFHDGEERHVQRPECGLFFSGGVDSFFSLQCEQQRLSHLIYVEGYDVSLNDPARLERVLEWNRAVAEETGKKLITVRTNLRQHRLFRSINWEIAYGAALGTMAHLLREVCGTFLVSAAYSILENYPFGTHPEFDPLWSSSTVRTIHYGGDRTRRQKTAAIASYVPAQKYLHAFGSHPELDPLWSSSAVRIVHYGGDRTRRQKTAAIASYVPAQRYLRVCWENRSPELNCGECEKCVRTQVELLTTGDLERITTFPNGSLSERIDRLSRLEKHLLFFYEEMIDHIDAPDVRQAIDALLVRSRECQPPQPWYRRLFRDRGKCTT
jgi:hypothetical protein